MKRTAVGMVLLAFALALAAHPALAQAAAAGTAPTSGPRAEALRLLDDAATKFVRLAEKMPAEKYTWRPSEGVRSVSEVFLHVVLANYLLLRPTGVQPPADFNLQEFETSTTDKAKVVEALKASFAHVRNAVLSMSDADMDKTAPWYGGRQASYREVLFLIASHEHEHLGQSIAYARVNGIVPPWTEEQQQRQQAPPKKQP